MDVISVVTVSARRSLSLLSARITQRYRRHTLRSLRCDDRFCHAD